MLVGSLVHPPGGFAAGRLAGGSGGANGTMTAGPKTAVGSVAGVPLTVSRSGEAMPAVTPSRLKDPHEDER